MRTPTARLVTSAALAIAAIAVPACTTTDLTLADTPLAGTVAGRPWQFGGGYALDIPTDQPLAAVDYFAFFDQTLAPPTSTCDFPEEMPARSFGASENTSCDSNGCPAMSVAPGEYDDYVVDLFGLADGIASAVRLRIDHATLDGIDGAIAWRDDAGDEVSGTFNLLVCID